LAIWVSSFVTVWGAPCSLSSIALIVGLFPGWQSLLVAPLFAACSLGVSWTVRIWSNQRYRQLGRQVAKRLADDGVEVDRCQGLFVQLAPSGELKLYDWHSEWDVGFLF
jgi:hypothetical protein